MTGAEIVAVVVVAIVFYVYMMNAWRVPPPGVDELTPPTREHSAYSGSDDWSETDG